MQHRQRHQKERNGPHKASVTTGPQAICSFCQALIHRAGPAKSGSRWLDCDVTRNLSALSRSARSCPFCRDFRNAKCVATIASSPYTMVSFASRALDSQPAGMVGVRLQYAEDRSIRNDEFSIISCESPVADRAIWKSPTLELADRLHVIRTWLAECDNSHQTCRDLAPFEAHLMASRLLHVQRTNGEFYVQLVDTAQTETVPYIALSHCWGSHVPIKSEIANLEAHMANIPFRNLPRTFRDALLLTHHLGISYCWIDSLCIVQDSDKDWRTEAAKMASIYANSFFTIAADSSLDSNGGCYLDASNPSLTVSRSSSWDGISSGCRGYMLRANTHYEQIIKDSPLYQRGWTLQETTLSPRVLHCTEQGMFWECRSRLASEDETQDFDSPQDLASFGYLYLKPDNLIHSWWQIAQAYSDRSFTFCEKDKLPAIAGLVRYFEKSLRESSILGLWRCNFKCDMGWFINIGPGDKEWQPSLSGRPSWSWLSQKNPIYMYAYFREDGPRGPDASYGEVDKHIELLDYQIDWAGQPYVSLLVSSKLLVSASTVTVPGSSLIDNADSWMFWTSPFEAAHCDLENTEVTMLLLYESGSHGYNHVHFMVVVPVQGQLATYRRLCIGHLSVEGGLANSPFSTAIRQQLRLV